MRAPGLGNCLDRYSEETGFLPSTLILRLQVYLWCPELDRSRSLSISRVRENIAGENNDIVVLQNARMLQLRQL